MAIAPIPRMREPSISAAAPKPVRMAGATSSAAPEAVPGMNVGGAQGAAGSLQASMGSMGAAPMSGTPPWIPPANNSVPGQRAAMMAQRGMQTGGIDPFTPLSGMGRMGVPPSMPTGGVVGPARGGTVLHGDPAGAMGRPIPPMPGGGMGPGGMTTGNTGVFGGMDSNQIAQRQALAQLLAKGG